MNTLHTCRLDDSQLLDSHEAFIQQGDSLLFYGSLRSTTWQALLKKLHNASYQWYVVPAADQPLDDSHKINHDQWLQLITEHQKTWAWK